MTDVYLHIGLAKTGTSSIQSALEASATSLRDAGVLFPGDRHQVQRNALYKVLGRRAARAPGAAGAATWQELTQQIDAWNGSAAVVSEELMAVARPRQAAALVQSLAAHRVFVILGLRDLASLIPSAWQQDIRQGWTYSWQQFLAAVRDPGEGAASAGIRFWLRQDALRVLDVWGQAVPQDRIRLLTLPSTGGADLLLTRFASACRLPAGSLQVSAEERNVSLGVVETELLRRLNATLRTTLEREDHVALVKQVVLPALSAEQSPPLVLPESERDWVVARTTAVQETLTRRGYEVHGDLAELAPRPSVPGSLIPDDLSDSDLFPTLERCLLRVLEGQVAKGARRRTVRREGDAESGVDERIRNRARETTHRLKSSAMEVADGNPALARLARSYLNVKGPRTNRADE